MHRGTFAILAMIALLASACGQKGALYLPDRNAKVVTRPASSQSPQGEGAAPPAGTPQGAGGQPATNPDDRKKNEGDATSTSPAPKN
jgi:predicted small lipoprotein YifL